MRVTLTGGIKLERTLLPPRVLPVIIHPESHKEHVPLLVRDSSLVEGFGPTRELTDRHMLAVVYVSPVIADTGELVVFERSSREEDRQGELLFMPGKLSEVDFIDTNHSANSAISLAARVYGTLREMVEELQFNIDPLTALDVIVELLLAGDARMHSPFDLDVPGTSFGFRFFPIVFGCSLSDLQALSLDPTAHAGFKLFPLSSLVDIPQQAALANSINPKKDNGVRGMLEVLKNGCLLS